MQPAEPLERLWAAARRASSAPDAGDPGAQLQPLPWAKAPPADPEGVRDMVHRTGIPALGTVVPPDRRRAWAEDPATGMAWPPGPGESLELLGQPLDPRVAWELGRLQHLVLLAASDPDDPTPLEDVRHFRQAHPMGWGLPWASTLEVALRLVSLVQIGAAWPQPDVLLAVAEHAQWLARWPSVGSSARNHRVAELAALAVAAWALPDARDRPRWQAEAARLRDVLHDQVHRDGVGIEQSTHYLAFVLEWALVARSVGIQELDGPMVSAVRCLSTLIDATGRSVRLGDSDDGCVVPVCPGPEPDYVTSVVGAAASALGVPAPGAWAPDRRTKLLASAPASERVDPGSASFPEGGLTVFRDQGRLVVFDHGPLGEPGLSAHGHADALGVWVHAPSGPVIVGRGTGRYNADPSARRFHRSSLAHPTVVVDGLSQSEPHAHPFLWRARARTVLHELDLGRGHVVASHAGYRRRLGIDHRRHVDFRGTQVVLEDALIGRSVHHVAISLPLAPDCGVRHEGRHVEVLREDAPVLEIHPDPRCDVRVVRGGPVPGCGQHSAHYGRWEPACTVILEVRCRLPLELCTTIRFVASAGAQRP